MISVSDLLIRSLSGFLFMLPVLVLYFVFLNKWIRKQSIFHMVGAGIFCYYLFGILTVTGIGYTSRMNFAPDFSLVPFVDMVSGPVDTILNILLFVPLGFLLPLLYKKYWNLKRTVLTGLAVCLLVEFFQMFGWGTSDINDLITNTTGTLLGFLLFAFISRTIPSRFMKTFQSRGIHAEVEVCFLVLCCFVMMMSAQIWFVHSILNI